MIKLFRTLQNTANEKLMAHSFCYYAKVKE